MKVVKVKELISFSLLFFYVVACTANESDTSEVFCFKLIEEYQENFESFSNKDRLDYLAKYKIECQSDIGFVSSFSDVLVASDKLSSAFDLYEYNINQKSKPLGGFHYLKAKKTLDLKIGGYLPSDVTYEAIESELEKALELSSNNKDLIYAALTLVNIQLLDEEDVKKYLYVGLTSFEDRKQYTQDDLEVFSMFLNLSALYEYKKANYQAAMDFISQSAKVLNREAILQEPYMAFIVIHLLCIFNKLDNAISVYNEIDAYYGKDMTTNKQLKNAYYVIAQYNNKQAQSK